MKVKTFHTFEVQPNEVDPNDRHAAQMAPGFYWQPNDETDEGTCFGPFATKDQAMLAAEEAGYMPF